jgi:hypothetical protein
MARDEGSMPKRNSKRTLGVSVVVVVTSVATIFMPPDVAAGVLSAVIGGALFEVIRGL